MASRKLGCLTLFLFLALCASVIVNIFLTIAVVGRVTGGRIREEPWQRFREIVVQRGAREINRSGFFGNIASHDLQLATERLLALFQFVRKLLAAKNGDEVSFGRGNCAFLTTGAAE